MISAKIQWRSRWMSQCATVCKQSVFAHCHTKTKWLTKKNEVEQNY